VKKTRASLLPVRLHLEEGFPLGSRSRGSAQSGHAQEYLQVTASAAAPQFGNSFYDLFRRNLRHLDPPGLRRRAVSFAITAPRDVTPSAALRISFFFQVRAFRVIGKEFMNTPWRENLRLEITPATSNVLRLMMGLGVPYRFVAKSEVHGICRSSETVSSQDGASFVCSYRHKFSDVEAIKTNESRCSRWRFRLRFFRKVHSFPKKASGPFQLGAFNAAVVTGVPSFPFRCRHRVVFCATARSFLAKPLFTITLSSTAVAGSFPKTGPSDWHRSCSPARTPHVSKSRGHSGETAGLKKFPKNGR